MQTGPTLTDDDGELEVTYLSCKGCDLVRVHDFHYFYCRALGDANKPDFKPYNGGMTRLYRYPTTPGNCPYLKA